MAISIYAPLNDFVNIFSWVHSFYMGFKVIASRPRLIALFTSFHRADVAYPTDFAMNRTFVSLQIV